jgi:hypothetical protein
MWMAEPIGSTRICQDRLGLALQDAGCEVFRSVAERRCAAMSLCEEVACHMHVTVLDLTPKISHGFLQVVDFVGWRSCGFGLDVPTIGRLRATM